MPIFKNPDFDFLKWRWPAVGLSCLVIAAGAATAALQGGLSLGIDFSGGTQVIVQFDGPVTEDAVRDAVVRAAGESVVQQYGDPDAHEILIRLPQGGPEEGASLEEGANTVVAALEESAIGGFTVIGQELVGPVIGQELQRRGINAFVFAMLGILVYVAFLVVPVTFWVLYRTRFGLRLRAVGENPEAVDTAGISVAGMRYRALLVCGALCGVAGAYLATAQSAAFIKDMTAGKGFIALAALIFGKWRPVPAMAACLLFGFLEAVAARLQGTFDLDAASGFVRALVAAVPFVIEALPYILVVLLLAGFVGTAVAPRASGLPYVKEGG